MVSGMAGSDVGIIQPPFSVLPQESSWGCAYIGSAAVTEEKFDIENVPYQFAIPMLTGWNLQYDCNDEHVKEIGMWISDWSYDPPATGAGGTLHYSLFSILRDNDNEPPYMHDHKVTVLGLRPIAGGNNVKGVNGNNGKGRAIAAKKGK
jgi:hypothetical protein